MQPHELIRAQRVLRLQNTELAETLGVTPSTISFWRCGHVQIPGPASLAIRMLIDNDAREQYLKRLRRDDE